MFEDLLEDLGAGATFGEGFVGEADAVEDDIFGEGEDVFGDDVVAAVDEGAGAGGLEEGDADAGGGTEFEVGVVAGAFDDIDDVFEEDIADVDGVDGFHGGDEVGFGADGVLGDEVELGFGDGAGAFFFDAEVEVAAEDFLFFGGVGVAEAVSEHEAVELCFGEFKGAALFDGVLGGDDQEGGGEVEGFVAEGDLAFLHGLEEGALDLGGGAVDFVGEEEVGEDGALVGAEAAGFFVEDFGAEDIGGEEVDGELDAAEVEVQGAGDGVDEEGLGEAGDALEEEVAAGEEGDEGAFDDDLLADDDLADTVADGLDVGGGGFGGGVRGAQGTGW